MHEMRTPEWDIAKCDEWYKTLTSETKYVPENSIIYQPTQKIVHYTIIFQVFVFMQIFNLINARKIGDEINVFSGFFRNQWFIIIFVLTIVIQCALVEFGGRAVKTESLNVNENLICLGFGALELVWGLILKFLPLGWF